jgi:folate-dependent tRNA-U54 methylase TrmFO/GidA
MDTDELLDTYYEHLRTRTVMAMSNLASVAEAIVSLALDGVEDITAADIAHRAAAVSSASLESSLVKLQALGMLTVAGHTPTGSPIYVVAPALGLLAAADLEADMLSKTHAVADDWTA